MLLRRSFSTSLPRRYSPAHSMDIPDACFAMGRLEQAKLSLWLVRNLTTNTEVSSQELSPRSIRKSTQDMNIRSRCPSPIFNSTMKHLWTCLRTAEHLSSISSKMRRVMSLSKVWLEEELRTKNKLFKCYSKERTIRQWLNIDSTKIVQGHTLFSQFIFKWEVRWRVVRR